MTGEELLTETETETLEQYLATFDELFGRSESRAHGRLAWLGSTAEALASAATGWRFKKCERLKVHDTQKGPEVWEFKAGPFWEQGENAPAGAQWLLIARNVRTEEIKYFLSNAP